MHFSTHWNSPKDSTNPLLSLTERTVIRHVLLGLMQHCSEPNAIRTSCNGKFGTYCGCLGTQRPLEDPATQRSVTAKSDQTATEIRNTPSSTGKVHEINTCVKMRTYRRVSCGTSASSTLERLELDYLLWFPTSVHYWRAYMNKKYGLSCRNFICHKVADISAPLQTDSKVYSPQGNPVLDAQEVCSYVSKIKKKHP
jgi:hypothetical protein